MTTKDQLIQYVNYNLWANGRLADIIIKLDPSLLDKEIKSSFPSLRKTVHHIWDAELAWLARLKKEVVNWPPSAQFKDPSIQDFLKTSETVLNFVTAQPEIFFESSTAYKNSRGEAYEDNNHGIIMHCMNHSTFHRGQIVTVLRELGVTQLPSTDLITFLHIK